ncbi:MAG: HAD-IIB family hydrolase [Muribaculaceae bacterium]|nr:HAD-IIB family hydrolase [Muribaculaceae bacterium]
MEGKTLYVSDLDGTLLGNDSLVSPRSVALLNEAIACGALFSVATARTPATVGPLMQEIDLKIPTVVMTGVALWDSNANHYLDVQYMQPDIPGKLLEIYRNHRVPTFLYTLEDHRIQMYHQGELTDLEREFLEARAHTPYKRVRIDQAGHSDIPDTLDNTLLFYAMYPTKQALKVYEETRLIPEINPLFYHDIYGPEIALLEAFPEGATKAKAVRRLADRVGADRIVAFGDNLNDIPMLKIADVAVAVENAVEEVKDVADIIIGENTADAVPEFILKDFRN